MNSSPFRVLDAESVHSEHLCCALASPEHEAGVAAKRQLLAAGLGHGLVFRKLDARGKVFIEYAPWEHAFRPVVAPGFLVIHCLWVSGRFKGQGLGVALLESCRADADHHRGVVAVSGTKPYLTDTPFYLAHGFQLIASTPSGFDLVAWTRDGNAAGVDFSPSVRRGTVRHHGVHFEHAAQCPFVPRQLELLAEVARGMDLPVSMRHLATPEEARTAASPFGTFGVFLDGAFLTHELMAPAKFEPLLRAALARSRPTRR